MSKQQNHPTDDAIAHRIGQLEMNRIRMGWMLEQQQAQMTIMTARINELVALLTAKDAEIARLQEAPGLPLEHVNGKATEFKH